MKFNLLKNDTPSLSKLLDLTGGKGNWDDPKHPQFNRDAYMIFWEANLNGFLVEGSVARN